MTMFTGRRFTAALATLGLTALLGLAVVSPANAAELSRAELTTTVRGTSVTAGTTVYANPTTWAREAGICVRDADGGHWDFDRTSATLRARGTTFTGTRTFPAGTYTYWACAEIDGRWTGIGTRQTFTVPATGEQKPWRNGGLKGRPAGPSHTPAPAAPASTPSGEAMPVGDLPNWKQVFTEDFTTPVARGAFPGASYSGRWTMYDDFSDTYGAGRYDRTALSVRDGALDLYMHTNSAGQPISNAPVPIVTKAWEGQTYGRYSVRFKSDKLPGYKAAWLLWPTSDDWNQGEIDFPEGDLDGDIWGFNHCIGNPAANCFHVDTGVSFDDWHTATIEWQPGRLTYILDGEVVGTTTHSVPDVPMRWVLQTETAGSAGPAAHVAGSVLIDWVTVYTWNG